MKKALFLFSLVLCGFGAECPTDAMLPNGGGNSNENSNDNTGSPAENLTGDSDWPQMAKITAFDPNGDDLYGDAIAASTSTLAVASELKDSLAGVVDVYTLYRGEWVYQARLERGDARMPEQSFGSSIAVSNSQIFVGAQKYAIPGSFHIQRGAVYVFTFSGPGYSQEQILTINDGEDFEYFGNAMAFESNQRHLIVGAFGRNNMQGAAYVFKTNGGTFSQTARLTASDGASSDDFGTSVAMSNVWAAVGAPGKQSGLGAVYVYERAVDDWSEIQKISAPDGEQTDNFGSAIAMDGNLLVISAPTKKRMGDDLLQAGAVYVYRRVVGTYVLEDTIIPDDENAGLFGNSLSVLDDKIAIGIEGKSRVVIYEDNGSEWKMTAKIEADDTQAINSFGNAAVLTDDFLAVGSRSADANGQRAAGAAYVFTPPGVGGPNIPPGVRAKQK